MKINVGQIYECIDVKVPQGTPRTPPQLRILDIYDYLGQYIVYAAKLTHQQHVYIHGFEDIVDRPAAFVVLPGELPENIDRLSLIFKGRPLRLRSLIEEIPIVNGEQRLGSLWTLAPGRLNRDTLIPICQTMINIYHEWKRLGVVPGWVRKRINTVQSNSPSG